MPMVWDYSLDDLRFRKVRRANEGRDERKSRKDARDTCRERHKRERLNPVTCARSSLFAPAGVMVPTPVHGGRGRAGDRWKVAKRAVQSRLPVAVLPRRPKFDVFLKLGLLVPELAEPLALGLAHARILAPPAVIDVLRDADLADGLCDC